jgi:hypothetical protein
VARLKEESAKWQIWQENKEQPQHGAASGWMRDTDYAAVVGPSLD